MKRSLFQRVGTRVATWVVLGIVAMIRCRANRNAQQKQREATDAGDRDVRSWLQVQSGAHQGEVLEWLGEPSQRHGSTWTYRRESYSRPGTIEFDAGTGLVATVNPPQIRG